MSMGGGLCCGVLSVVALCAPPGVPQGPGVGPPAAAQLVEEDALPQGGARGEAHPADDGQRCQVTAPRH